MGFLYLECNESVFCMGESHLGNVRSVFISKQDSLGSGRKDICVACSDAVKHVITGWWVLWQYAILCC